MSMYDEPQLADSTTACDLVNPSGIVPALDVVSVTVVVFSDTDY